MSGTRLKVTKPDPGFQEGKGLPKQIGMPSTVPRRPTSS